MIKNYTTIPFLSSISQPIELNDNNNYLTTNLFDYNYYSKIYHSVTLIPIGFDDVINFQEDLFKTYQEYTINYQIGNNSYKIDLKRIYLTIFFSNYKEKLLEQYLLRIGYNFNFSIHKEQGSKTSNYSNKWIQLNKLANSLFELINFRKNLVEKHSNVNSGDSCNQLFTNYLYIYLNRRKIEKKVNEIFEKSITILKIPPEYYLEFKVNIRLFLTTLHYLDFKKYDKISISNFSGMMQYAAIEYVNVKEKKIDILQHGRYMFHHRPAPEKVVYLPNAISLWEEEFIDKLVNKKSVNRISFVSRNPLSKDIKVMNYILIATSSPLAIDIDIYYRFWEIIQNISNNKDFNICVKMHPKDIITHNIINFLGLNEKIVHISNIEFLPKCAITLNSTIYYELIDYVPVFDFKYNHNYVDVENFIHSYIAE